MPYVGNKRKAQRWKAICDEMGFVPTHIAEVGVCRPEMCETQYWITNPNILVELFEPQAAGVALLEAAYHIYPNVIIHPVAIVDEEGECVLEKPNPERSPEGGARIKGTPWGIWVAKQSIRVNGCLFSQFDDGTFDLVKIDTEGCDWFTIKHMKSRPRVIIYEEPSEEKQRLKEAPPNPYQKEIRAWMDANGYEFLEMVRDDDRVYVLPGHASAG